MTWLAFWNRSVRTAPAAGGGNQSWRLTDQAVSHSVLRCYCWKRCTTAGPRRSSGMEGLTVVSLNGKDAGRVGEVRLVGDQCCRALRSACMHGVTERPLKLPVMLATSLMQFCISALPD